MEAKAKVLDWINKNFDISKVKLKDFPVLPGGTLVIDKNKDTMMVFYDFLNNRVLYALPNEPGFKAAV